MSLCEHDKVFINKGYSYLAGVDEVGRGPLAGPVVAACVIIDGTQFAENVNDSKKLSHKRRESMFDIIKACSVGVGTGLISHDEIDRINIRQATLLAMKSAVIDTGKIPEIILIDGLDTIDMPYLQKSIIQGDAKSYAIAAASIIAKVLRDRMMVEYALLYPEYGFEISTHLPECPSLLTEILVTPLVVLYISGAQSKGISSETASKPPLVIKLILSFCLAHPEKSENKVIAANTIAIVSTFLFFIIHITLSIKMHFVNVLLTY